MCLLKSKCTVTYDDVSTGTKAKVEKWERPNWLSLMVIKRTISESIYGGIPSSDNAIDFLEAIGQKFKEANTIC